MFDRKKSQDRLDLEERFELIHRQSRLNRRLREIWDTREETLPKELDHLVRVLESRVDSGASK